MKPPGPPAPGAMVQQHMTRQYAKVQQRDRVLVLLALVMLIIMAWAYLIYLDLRQGTPAAAMMMPAGVAWTASDVLFMFMMWAIMMFAMMLPSVTPTVMIFERVRRQRQASGRAFAPAGAFVAGYLIAWAGFSGIATGINWWLHTNGFMSSMMGAAGPQIAGVLLVVAGVFQWTRLKDACRDHCRSPMSFLMQQWREGNSGAVVMGLHHGAYCLGCCWLLMLLLFVLGVMNLPWVALLTVIVLAEKTLPWGRYFSRAFGALLIPWGLWLVLFA